MILDSQATEQEKVFLGFHEFAHLVFHLPAGLTPESPQVKRIERGANTIGKLALMPEPIGLSIKEIMSRYDVSRDIAKACASVKISEGKPEKDRGDSTGCPR